MSADNVQAAINAPPFGLLDLLQTKALGQNPNELLQGVRATVDLQTMWAQGAPVQTVVLGGNMTALGIQTGAAFFATVPASKVWIPVSFSVQTVPGGAGDVGRARPCIFQTVGAVQNLIEIGPVVFLSAGPASVAVCSWNFLETPVRAWAEGFSFGLYVETVTVAVSGIIGSAVFRYIEM